jgi:hypothetical protein
MKTAIRLSLTSALHYQLIIFVHAHVSVQQSALQNETGLLT